MKKYHQPIRFSVYGVHHYAQHSSFEAVALAQKLGSIIAEHAIILNIPGVPGFPYWVAKGAYSRGGMVVGFSPAANEREHIQVYDVPLEYTHTIIYSGFGYSGSDLLMSRSTDAFIFGYGGIGVIHEFLMAFAEGKPIGILKGDWDTHEVLYHLLKDRQSLDHRRIVFESDPEVLVEKLEKLARECRTQEYHITE
jgi:uncharacterized protein (TIGR00725 family)